MGSVAPGLAGIRIPESLVAEPGESLGRPWAVPAAEATLLRWERWLPHGLIATLLLGCGFNLGKVCPGGGPSVRCERSTTS